MADSGRVHLTIDASTIELLTWVAQTLHQAHHRDEGGTWLDCPKNTCRAMAERLREAGYATKVEALPRRYCRNEHPEIVHHRMQCPLCEERAKGYRLAERFQDLRNERDYLRERSHDVERQLRTTEQILAQTRGRIDVLVASIERAAILQARVREPEPLDEGRDLSAFDESSG